MTHQHNAATLYHNHAASIRRYLFRRVRDMDLADDLCNDVFVRIIESLPHYDERGLPIEAWLYRIAHDKAVDAIRRMARYPAVTIEEHHATMLDHTTIESDPVLQHALARLNDDQRKVILLRYCDDYSISEIAQLLNRSEGAIKQLRNRGVALLRTHYTATSSA
ncbi:MAG: RNA polymerase sigma factor [Roseiflexaceae bacterium]|jgi:RNA polymerase sigma-70 factor (ECF subfamily)|nr:RNA polymerase sigma factor [Chloroflexaceae bacterium]